MLIISSTCLIQIAHKCRGSLKKFPAVSPNYNNDFAIALHAPLKSSELLFVIEFYFDREFLHGPRFDIKLVLLTSKIALVIVFMRAQKKTTVHLRLILVLLPSPSPIQFSI